MHLIGMENIITIQPQPSPRSALRWGYLVVTPEQLLRYPPAAGGHLKGLAPAPPLATGHSPLQLGALQRVFLGNPFVPTINTACPAPARPPLPWPPALSGPRPPWGGDLSSYESSQVRMSQVRIAPAVRLCNRSSSSKSAKGTRLHAVFDSGGRDKVVKGIHLWALVGWVAVGLIPVRAEWKGAVACLGQVAPGERMVLIAAPVGAIIRELSIHRGSRVEKGAVIAVLRDAMLHEAHVERARQQLALAQAELDLVLAGERRELVEAQQALIAAHQAEASMLENRLARFDLLGDARYVSKDEYEMNLSQLASLHAKIRREQSVLESFRSSRAEVVTKAEMSLRVAAAQVAEAEAALELQHIRAPFAGEIIDIHAWPGEGVGATREVASLGDVDNMMVLAEVYESDLPRVAVGHRASIRGQAFEGTLDGTVVEVQKMLEGSRVFPVDPSAYVDRRVVTVRIQPDEPEALAAFSHAQVTVTIRAP